MTTSVAWRMSLHPSDPAADAELRHRDRAAPSRMAEAGDPRTGPAAPGRGPWGEAVSVAQPGDRPTGRPSGRVTPSARTRQLTSQAPRGEPVSHHPTGRHRAPQRAVTPLTPVT